MNAVHAFFSWPAGGIWANLLASVIVAVVAFFWKIRPFLREAREHHEKIAEIHALVVKENGK